MKYFKILITLTALVFATTSVYAENTWKAYLNSDQIQDMAVDGQYVWCATSGGAVRWNSADGSYHHYTSLDGLGWNNVMAVAVDNSGTKWFAGNWSGVNSFDGTTWETHINNNLSGQNISSIAVDRDNNLWFDATGLTVWSFDRITWKKYTIKEGNPKAIMVDTDNRKWIATENGAVCFDGDTWTIYTTDDGLVDNKVYSTAVDKNGVLWFGTSKGVSSFNGTAWTTYPWENYTDEKYHTDLNGNIVRTIAVDDNNVKWLGTDWSGAASFDGSTWTIYTMENSGLKDNDVHKIVIDHINSKWFSYDPGDILDVLTVYDGVNWYDFQAEGPADNSVMSIGVDNDNTMWFGTLGGTSLFDGTSWSTIIPPDFPTNWYFYDFAVDNEGISWIGTGAGVSSFDGVNWTLYSTENSGLVSNSVYAVAVDPDNTKWFGTTDGVSSFDGQTWATYTEANGLVDNTIYAIAVDSNNTTWFGTRKGLSSFDGSLWTTHDAGGFLVEVIVRDIAVDMDNVKWIGTDNGVASFDGEQWTIFTTENSGLVYDFVVSIAIDHNNVKWFGCAFNGGLASFDGTTWKQYTRRDGLVSEQINDIAVDRNNVKWFATNYGIASYDDTKQNNPAFTLSDVPQQSLKLTGNYPNPFNPSTTIEFTLSESDFTTIAIYNITGQKIRELAADYMPAGTHSLVWDGKDVKWQYRFIGNFYFPFAGREAYCDGQNGFGEVMLGQTHVGARLPYVL